MNCPLFDGGSGVDASPSDQTYPAYSLTAPVIEDT